MKYAEVRRELCELHAELPANELVASAAVKAAVMTEDVAHTAYLAHRLAPMSSIEPDDVDALHERYTTEYGQDDGPR